MSEERRIQYTQWEDQPGSYEACQTCRKNGDISYGIMLRRRVTGRDGDMHTEYKIMCRNCGCSTDAHRFKSITEMEWESKQTPEDGFRHRRKMGN